MRNIFLLLVLLNLLVLIYQRWILGPSQVTQISAPDQAAPMLQLAGRPTTDDPAAVELPPGEGETDSEPSAPELRCVRFGPFASRADADAVRSDLRKRGAEVSQSSDQGQVWVGHWVQVSDQGSRAAAEKARSELSAADIDTYILPDDEIHALSLGIYRKRTSAERVQKKAQRLGYKTLVVDRFQPGTIFWLRVKMADDGTALRAGEFQGDTGQILRTETVPCTTS